MFIRYDTHAIYDLYDIRTIALLVQYDTHYCETREMPRTQRFALILFDEDGYTSVVPTSGLHDYNGELQQSTVCKYQEYKVEVLKLSDTKKVLNNYEAIWSTSLRASEISKAILQHGSKKNDYLLILPGSDNNIDIENAKTNDDDNSTAILETTTIENSKTNDDNNSTAILETTPTENINEPSEIEEVIAQQVTSGKRKRNDNTETIYYMNENHSKKRTVTTQTESVVVFENENQLTDLVKPCACHEMKATVNNHTQMLEHIVKCINELGEKFTDRLDRSFMSVDLIEQFTGNIVSLKESPANVPDNQFVHLNENQVELPDNQALPLKDNQIEEQDTEDEHMINAPVEFSFVQDEAIQDEVKENSSTENEQVFHEQGIINNETDITHSTPRHVPTYVMHKIYSIKCSQGQLVEISSAHDIIPGDFEFRINPITVRHVNSYSVSLGNFGWNLVQQLFSADELVGRNYRGGKGKLGLSPRRVHAIEHAVSDLFGNQGNNLKQIANAVNGALRNKFIRRPLEPVFGNFN
ncbi:hypothetical protein ACF0H5_001395 [Mactra antiquata]